jgi:peptidoglycan/xylan/chitin deacetylase (PgdA/CDA1 family)
MINPRFSASIRVYPRLVNISVSHRSHAAGTSQHALTVARVVPCYFAAVPAPVLELEAAVARLLCTPPRWTTRGGGPALCTPPRWTTRGGGPALVAALAVLLVTAPSAQQTPQATPQPWTLTPDQIREIVQRVRAGRDLTPKTWPNGARVAVGLSFDLDNETGTLRDGSSSPALLSQGEYGSRAGLPRVLALLDRHRIGASFFVPAVSALLHEDSMKAIIKAGNHEIGLHGWIHERNSQLDATTERDLLTRAAKTLESITTKRPAGMRTPSWDYSPATIQIAKELGLVYDSSLMADDRPYEVLAANQPTGIVELPVEWILDDFPYFWMDRSSTVRPTMTPDEVFSIWKGEFDGAYEERGMFILTMHPHVIGHRARIAMLDRLVTYMKSKPGVWFATHEQIARYVKEQAR